MPVTELPVDHLFTISADVENGGFSLVPGAPQGTRVVVNVTGGTFEGPRLKGTIQGPGGDWVTVRDNGSFQLDVRISLVTDDGANILMQYKGIGHRTDDGNSLRTAPLFEVGDERYSWLNDIQAVGIGSSTSTGVTYEVYALK